MGFRQPCQYADHRNSRVVHAFHHPSCPVTAITPAIGSDLSGAHDQRDVLDVTQFIQEDHLVAIAADE